MEKDNNLVIFDFCDTIASFQSADEFCRYILRKETRTTYLAIDRIFSRFYIYRLLAKLKFKRFTQKHFLLRGLKGLNYSKLDYYGLDFVNEVINNRLNKEVFSRFLSHIEKGHAVLINSGGYEPYLKYFATLHNIRYVFATRFKYENNVFTGKIEGDDCLGFEKVRRMQETGILDRNFSDIIVYSDSITDLPIFNLATQKVAVIKTSLAPKWCQNDFVIIKV